MNTNLAIAVPSRNLSLAVIDRTKPMTYSVLTPEDLRAVIAAIPKHVREILEEKSWHGNAFVAGGFIRAVVTGEKINDVDIFTTDLQRVTGLVESLGMGREVHSSPSAHSIDTNGFPVQVIRAWLFGNAFSCIKSFDFSICQAVVWNEGGAWRSATGENFYADLAAKRLRYTNPTRTESFVGGSLLRVLKHYQMGYTINVDSFSAVLSKIFKDIDPDWVNMDHSL